jgi:hypothetical protein
MVVGGDGSLVGLLIPLGKYSINADNVAVVIVLV